MALKVGDLYVSLTANVAQFAKSMASVARDVDRIAKKLQKLSREFSQFGLGIGASLAGAVVAAAKFDDEVAGALDRTKSLFGALAVEIARAALPVLRSFNDLIGQAVGWFQGLNPELKANIAEWAGIAAGVGLALAAFSKLAGLVSAVGSLVALLAGAVGTAFLPLILIIGVAVLEIGALYKAWNDTESGFREGVLRVVAMFKEGFGNIWTGVRAIFVAWLDHWAIVVRSVMTGVATIAEGMAKVRGKMFGSDDAGVKGLQEWAAGVRATAEGLTGEKLLGKLVDGVTWFATTVGGAVKTAVGYSVDGLTQMVTDGMAKLRAAVGFTGKQGAGINMDPKVRVGMAANPEAFKNADRAEKWMKAREESEKRIANATKALADKFVDAFGQLSGLIETAVTGMAAGGPLGAVVAVVGDLLMRSEAFQVLVANLNAIVQQVADALGMVIEPLLPLLPVIGILASVFTALMGPLKGLIEFAIRPLFEVLKFVATVIMQVVHGLGGFWNGIVSVIQGIMRSLSEISIGGWKPLEFLGEWATGLDGAKMDLDSLAKSIAELENLTYEEAAAKAQAVMETGKLNKATREATEAITNVPSWYRMSLARYQAIDPNGAMPGAGGGGGGGATTGGGGGGGGAGGPSIPTGGSGGGGGVHVYLDGHEVMQKIISKLTDDKRSQLGRGFDPYQRLVAG